MTLFRWDVPGYAVAFSTRLGGVSEGRFSSLNLGRRSGDDVENVDENRRRLCDSVGADVEQLTINYQTHSAVVRRARAGEKERRATGSGRDEPGVPLLALTADCCRSRSSARTAAASRCCTRGGGAPGRDRRGGCGRARRQARRRRRPCDRPVLLRGRAGGRRALRARIAQRVQPRSLARCRAPPARGRLRERRAARPVHALQPRPLLLVPPRRQATADRACSPMSPEQIRERYDAMKERAPGVTIVAATKYVSLEQMSVLAEAGVEVVGENRARTSRRSTRASPTRSAGTSSVTCRAARRRP